ncbi:MAG TPA: efflux RND transporter periplasmic adaptor subunit [Verrucomicrobiae bacterium]|nr:efflux RND transporter periplasmic adaptor subunit [Verrucomicrobiae bacterium]
MDMRSPNKIAPANLSAEPLTIQRPQPRRWKLLLRLGIMAAVIAAILVGLYAFEKFKEGMIAGFISAPRPPEPVAAVTVTTAAMSRYLDGIGSVRAVHKVTVSPELSGRVVKIMFESGASVQAGDPLVQLNDEPEQADLATFKAQAKLAEVTLSRNRKLANQQYTAQQTVDQNESDLAVAQAGMTHSEAVIAEKLVRAPFSGELGVRQIEVGQYLTAGTPIVTLTDLDNLYVDFTLPEQTRADLKVGQTVEIRVDAFKGRVFQAKLTTIEPQLDPEMRSIKVQASLDNPQHLLLPGMFGAARVLLPPQPDVVTLPETAVDYSVYGESVFILKPTSKDKDGLQIYTAEQTFVKTGPRHDGLIAITDGVKPGELVVSAGQVKLHTGSEAVVTGTGVLKTPTSAPTN